MKLERELTPDSLMLEVTPDSLNAPHDLNKSPNSRSEMRFELGKDKVVSSSRNGSLSTSPPESPSLHRADLYVNIDSPTKTETSIFSSPTRIQKELTPEMSATLLHVRPEPHSVDPATSKRSELHHNVGDHKVPKVGALELDVTLDAVEPRDEEFDGEPVDEKLVDPKKRNLTQSRPWDDEHIVEPALKPVTDSSQTPDNSYTVDSDNTDTTQYMDLPDAPQSSSDSSGDPSTRSKQYPDNVPGSTDSREPGDMDSTPAETKPNAESASPSQESDISSDKAPHYEKLNPSNVRSHGDNPEATNSNDRVPEPDSVMPGEGPTSESLPSTQSERPDDILSEGNESVEYSRTETAETEEMIETSVSREKLYTIQQLHDEVTSLVEHSVFEASSNKWLLYSPICSMQNLFSRRMCSDISGKRFHKVC